MSQYPYGFGNRPYSLDSIFNERAAPRLSQFYYNEKHHHQVIPVSGSGAPHYAQATHLYPMRAMPDRDSIYRYRPSDPTLIGQSGIIVQGISGGNQGVGGSNASMGGGAGNQGQAIPIPVVHLGASRNNSLSGTPVTSLSTQGVGLGSSTATGTSHSVDSGSETGSSVTGMSVMSGNQRIGSVGTVGNNVGNGNVGLNGVVSGAIGNLRRVGGLQTHVPLASGQSASLMQQHHQQQQQQQQKQQNDPEAEVDALTNLLMKSMETRPATSSASTNSIGVGGGVQTSGVGCTTPTPVMLDSSNTSPGGSLKRGISTSSGLCSGNNAVGSNAASVSSVLSSSGSGAVGPANNRIVGRLQQQHSLSSGISSGQSGGRGSPITTTNNMNTTGGVGVTSATGSPATASPTGSTSSALLGGGGGGLMGSGGGGDAGSQSSSGAANTTTGGGPGGSSSSNNSACFRCRRPLVPPEGSTLSTTTAINGPASAQNNVVQLTGALAVRLHVACFTCYRCATPLRPDAYYHCLRRLLCPTCVRDGAVETCSNCRRPIGDRVVRALGVPYHPGCFVCTVCSVRLDARPFTVDVHGRPHCLADFHRRYAPRCVHCGRPIAPEAGSQEARRVVAGDANYHLDCFSMLGATGSSGGSVSNSGLGISTGLGGTGGVGTGLGGYGQVGSGAIGPLGPPAPTQISSAAGVVS